MRNPIKSKSLRFFTILSSAKRFHDAIKAYEISLKLDYKRPELVLYNIACSYSLLSDEANTYKYLEKAIQKGYKAFEYMEKDPDLEYVRSLPEWKVKYKEIKKHAKEREDVVKSKG